jgi:hypothetical protein
LSFFSSLRRANSTTSGGPRQASDLMEIFGRTLFDSLRENYDRAAMIRIFLLRRGKYRHFELRINTSAGATLLRSAARVLEVLKSANSAA